MSYEKVGEQIYLELSASDFGGFVSDMENGTVLFNGSNLQDLDPPAAGINSTVFVYAVAKDPVPSSA